MSRSTANPAAQGQMREREKLQRKQWEADLRAVLALPAGRRLLWALIEHRAGAHSGTFCGENTHASAYAEGRRSIGREVMVEAQERVPDLYVRMVDEAMAKHREDSAARRAAESAPNPEDVESSTTETDNAD